jgi:hypothetical protein
MLSIDELNTFIVRAKANTYVGDGKKITPSRPASHDLMFQDGDFKYLDSYFGGTDFIGQEVVYYRDQPLWAMNYYGRIIKPDLINASQAGQIIKASLTEMYKTGRFLGGFENAFGEFIYTDTSEGNAHSFIGKEWITCQNQRVYELLYHGGLIKD